MYQKVNNQVTLLGNLGQDAEVFGTEERPAVRFDLATNESTSSDGETRTDWHRIVCWGGLAKSCRNLRKGDEVAVLGALRSQNWETEGVKYRRVEIHAGDVKFLRLKDRDRN